MTTTTVKAAAHTPGPWNVDVTKAHVGVYARANTEHGCRIAYVARSHSANARLIAAAPELLALLVELKASHYGAAVREEYEDRVKAVIAKVVGGA